MTAGDSSVFQPKIDANGVGGTASHRYYVLDNGGAKIDSVDVNFESTVSVEEQSIEFKAYPNPASGVFNVDMTTNSNTTSLVIYNILGEKVITKSLTNGLNKVAIDKLNNGVYFYSILNKNDIIETKKLIVRN